MAYGVALFYLAIRICWALSVLILRVFTVLFLSPVIGPRQKSQPRPRRGRAPIRRAKPQVAQAAGVLTASQGPMTIRGEPSRNEVDCAKALIELGFPKSLSTEISRKVTAELGDEAGLNARVKRGLQLLGPTR